MKTTYLKYIIIILFSVIAGATGYYFIFTASPSTTHLHKNEGQLYTCGMHPTIIEKEPGTCPICGMNLTLIKSSKGVSKEDGKIIFWRAPMDPNEIYNEPGKSKMGMDLVPVYENEELGLGVVTVDGSVLQSMNVKIETVLTRIIHNTIITNGILEIDETKEFVITTKISGWIEKLFVNYTGQNVKEGEKLLKIYSPELYSAQQELISSIEYAESKNYESKTGNLSTNELVQNAIKKLELFDIKRTEIDKIISTRKTNKYVTLFAPFDGTVLNKDVLEGEKINAGKPLMKIANLNNLWLKANIYENELEKVKLGNNATIKFSFNQDKIYSGTVTFISPTVDPHTRTVEVRIDINNSKSELKPKMFGTVEISGMDIENAIAVPELAILRSGKNNRVILSLGEGRFKPVAVKLGIYSMGYYQILDGLSKNDKIVTSGQFLIDSESNLKAALNLFNSSEQDEKKETKEESIVRTGIIDLENIDINKDKKVFQDPMDWNVISDKEGRCPLCNMFLVEVTIEEAKKNLKQNGFEYK